MSIMIHEDVLWMKRLPNDRQPLGLRERHRAGGAGEIAARGLRLGGALGVA